VLPRFATFFDEFDAKLPLTTRMMLSMGNFFGEKGWMVGIALILFALLLIMYIRSEPGQMAKDRLALRLPVVRELARAAIIERFSRILSAMVGAGVPISAAMTAAIDSTDNRVYSNALVAASKEMLEGQGLAAPITRTGLFPGTVTQMVRVGEETGTLDQQLHIAAEYYDKELEFKLDRMTALFEPLVIIFMGAIVGFVALALVQAMYGVYGQSGVGG
jgi:type IV pilus assembly protein PilC